MIVLAGLNDGQRHGVLFVVVAVLTAALGFLEWWTLPLVAFAASGLLVQQHYGRLRDILLITSLAPAVAWIVTAFIRDASEGFRISPKLASLLHIGPAFFVYVCLFFSALVVSASAAWSGAEMSKALR